MIAVFAHTAAGCCNVSVRVCGSAFQWALFMIFQMVGANGTSTTQTWGKVGPTPSHVVTLFLSLSMLVVEPASTPRSFQLTLAPTSQLSTANPGTRNFLHSVKKATWSCPHQTCQAAICIGLYSCRGLRCLGFPPSDSIVKLPATNSCSTTHTQDRLCCVPLHVFVPSNLSNLLLSESLTLSDPAPSSSSSSTFIRRTPSKSLSYLRLWYLFNSAVFRSDRHLHNVLLHWTMKSFPFTRSRWSSPSCEVALHHSFTSIHRIHDKMFRAIQFRVSRFRAHRSSLHPDRYHPYLDSTPPRCPTFTTQVYCSTQVSCSTQVFLVPTKKVLPVLGCLFSPVVHPGSSFFTVADPLSREGHNIMSMKKEVGKSLSWPQNYSWTCSLLLSYSLTLLLSKRVRE